MTNLLHDLTRSLRTWRQQTREHFPPKAIVLHEPKKIPFSQPISECLPLWDKFCSCQSVRKLHPPLMFGLTVASLTSVVGYRFYNQPRLSVGTVSPVTVFAPHNARFLDAKTTEEKRKEVRTGIVPILQQNTDLTLQLSLDLKDALQRIQDWRDRLAPFPFLSTAYLDLNSQHFFRSCSEAQWQQILAAITSSGANPPTGAKITANGNEAIAQLRTIKSNLSPTAFRNSLTQIQKARQRYQSAWPKGDLAEIEPLTLAQINPFLALSNADWRSSQTTIEQSANLILTQGIPAGLPKDLLRSSIHAHLKPAMPLPVQTAAVDLLTQLLRDRPTLIVDRAATKYHAEEAAQAIDPVMVTVKAGEQIIKRGETISQADFVLLDGLRLSRRRTNWQGLLLTAILVSGGIVIFCRVSRRIHRPLRRRDHILLCLLSLSVPIMGLIDPRYSSLPAIGLLSGSYYGATLAVTQMLLVGGLSAFALESIAWEYFLGSMAGSLLAAFFSGRLRSRDEVALLGGGVGLAQGTVYFVGHLILSASAGTVWYAILPGALFCGLVGMAWTVLALGISPYLERFFDVVTPIRLVELSNPNGSLLKRLATETPGTFQHTLFVACLAEAAARELHCNVELIRTGTLYHDIGKMHDPLGFIENQMGCANKHDQIGNPLQSVEIIKKHVSEGLVMARKYGLPRVVQDFIPEHQGTLLISYFYFQAQQQAQAQGLDPQTINQEDFRYPGPIPQSRETGIVMLADGCEAALRSLKEATPESALAMTHRVFKARWRDGQLEDCGLKYDELPIIAEVFVRVWQQFHHQRLSYPQAALEPPSIRANSFSG